MDGEVIAAMPERDQNEQAHTAGTDAPGSPGSVLGLLRVLEVRFDERSASVGTQLGGLDRRLVRVEDGLTSLRTEMNTGMAELRTEIADLRTEMARQGARIDALAARIDDSRQDLLLHLGRSEHGMRRLITLLFSLLALMQGAALWL